MTGRWFGKRRRGQSTVEYVLVVGLFSVVLSYAFWYAFMHSQPGQPTRLQSFLSGVVDFVRW